MSIPGKERQEFIEAASSYLSLKEWTEHIGEQQGGTIHHLTDDEAKRILDSTNRLIKVLRRLAFNHNVYPAIRFRGSIFALGLPVETLIVIPEDKIEMIDG